MPPARGMVMPIKPAPAPAGAAGALAAVVPAYRPSRSARTASTGRRVFAAAKIGGLKNFFIEQEQQDGWDAMVKGAAYLKTLS